MCAEIERKMIKPLKRNSCERIGEEDKRKIIHYRNDNALQEKQKRE